VGDDVVHPGPLKAPVEVLAPCDVPPGSLRAQAEEMLDAEVPEPAMKEVGGDEGPSGPLMGPVGQGEPWALLGQLAGRMPHRLGAPLNGVALG